MNSPTPPELFSQRPIRSDFGHTNFGARRKSAGRRAAPMIIALIVLAVSGVVGYTKFVGQNETPGEIPTIKAEGPVKQRPEQPGGIDIPHQDMLVFQQIENSDNTKAQGTGQVEHLLPPPEVPQAQPATAPTVTTTPVPPTSVALQAPDKAQQTGSTVASTSTTGQAVQPSSPTSPTQAEATAPAPAAAPTQAVTPAQRGTTVITQPSPTAAAIPSPIAAAPAAPVQAAPVQTKQEPVKPVVSATPTTAPAKQTEGKLPAELFQVGALQKAEPSPVETSKGGGSQVQLASSPDQASAQSMMDKLQAKLSGVMGAGKLRLVKATLAKGTFYRVQGPAMSEADAKNLCTKIKQTKTDCIVAH